jgi:glucose/arabinose dehydrogenase
MTGMLLLTSSALSRPASAANLVDPNLEVTSTQPGLSLPTGMRFLGENDAFVIEKNTGKVKRVQGSTVTDVLDLDVSTSSERGLIGIELHPDFDTNNLVYLQYSLSSTPGDGTGNLLENRVSRFTWDATAQTLGNEQSIFSIAFDATQPNGPNHNGGPMRFGADGKLYIATGDQNRDRAEQNNTAMTAVSASTGGIYRINDDGTIPTDNPFFSHTNESFHSLYAYGVRNSFGIAFDPETDALWDTENGAFDYDEVNIVMSGFNSGWDTIMGPELNEDGNPRFDRSELVHIGGTDTYSDPEFSMFDPIGITSIVFLTGSALGEAYDDAVIIGDDNTGDLHIFRLNENRDGFVLTGDLADMVADTPEELEALLFGTGFGTVTDLQIGPDGALYALSLLSGEIHRITLVPEPGTAGLLALGLISLGVARRRDAKRSA